VRAILDKLHGLPEKATLLCLSPISKHVILAYINVAKELHTPICFVASLNQVDKDGGYTGWTPEAFRNYVLSLAKEYSINTPIILELDHGGPWLKDLHIARNYTYEEALNDFLKSLEAFVRAGFNVIHIDTTIDLESKTRYADVEIAAKRTADLILRSEEIASRYGARLEYEIGSDRWGFKPVEEIEKFISSTLTALKGRGFDVQRIVFGVADVGTEVKPDNKAYPQTIYGFSTLMRKYGLYLKIHSGDYLENPNELPKNFVGGVNIGPMLAHVMYSAVKEALQKLEKSIAQELLQELNQLIADSDKLGKYIRGGIGEVEEYKIGIASRYVWSTSKAQNILSRISKLANINIEEHIVNKLIYVIRRYVVELNLHRIE